MTEEYSFELIGYDCPLGRYPAPVTPIVRDSYGNYQAVYLDVDLKLVTELVNLNAEFTKFSDEQKKKLEQFDCRKHRFFAVSKNDIRVYNIYNESLFFEGLLADESFSCHNPFVRISLAKGTRNPNTLKREIESGERYLQKYDRKLLPLLEKEKSKLANSIENDKPVKPRLQNCKSIKNTISLGDKKRLNSLIFN